MTSISAGTCMRFDSISMFALRLNIYLQIDCISHHMKIISYLPRQNLLDKVGFNSTIRHATVKTSVRVKCSSSIPVDHSIIKVSSQISVNHSFCTNERKHKWSLLRLQACKLLNPAFLFPRMHNSRLLEIVFGEFFGPSSIVPMQWN